MSDNLKIYKNLLQIHETNNEDLTEQLKYS